MKNFKITFRWGKYAQWIDVTVWDVHPNTFQNWGGGRWAYFEIGYEHPRRGKFGELHVVESGIREDTVAHEMLHVLCGWLFCKWLLITPNTEEKNAERLDELVRKFYRGYRKL